MDEPSQSITLDCGIAYSRLEGWLDCELVLPCADDGCWTYDSNGATCIVKLSRLENRTFGIVSLERTQITIDGDGAAIASLMRLFTLRFISAGG